MKAVVIGSMNIDFTMNVHHLMSFMTLTVTLEL